MRTARLPIALAICLALLGVAVTAAGAQVTFSIEVPAGGWKAGRLRDVPKGALVTVEAETSGQIGVALLDLADYRRFPSPVRPLFRGEAETRLSFSVTTPAAGEYFVILDNRSGTEPRQVRVTVRGSLGGAGEAGGEKPPAAPDGRGSLAEAEEKLREFEQNLRTLFVFEPFPIRVNRCGAPRAFSGQFGIVLCQEYAQRLYATLGDKAKAADALVFTLFHEVGHVLLRQWGYPFFANEDLADEFATAVMVMLGQQERVRAKAEYFAANPALAEAMAKAFRDDRHSLSAQRARNIARWLKDPALVRRWQTIFVPHMQTAVLERLRQKPTAWTELALVEKEMAARR